jgi:hypothetical protein
MYCSIRQRSMKELLLLFIRRVYTPTLHRLTPFASRTQTPGGKALTPFKKTTDTNTFHECSSRYYFVNFHHLALALNVLSFLLLSPPCLTLSNWLCICSTQILPVLSTIQGNSHFCSTVCQNKLNLSLIYLLIFGGLGLVFNFCAFGTV